MRPRLSLVPGSALLVLLALPLLLGGGVLTAALLAPTPTQAAGPADDAEPAVEVPPPAGLLVEVTGAVAHPGLYRLPRGERVEAAIAAAGGVTDQADPNRMPNLAARLRDGQQIRVPFLRGAAVTSSSSSTARVNLNTATEEELLSVPGFTPDLALAAVRQRELFGGFSSTRELVSVLGMSEADYAVARRYLTV
jgi:competence protein ComEA